MGVVIAGLLGAGSIPSVLSPSPDGETGPPLVVLAVDSLLGLVVLVAAIIAWRSGSRGAIRVVAGSSIIIAITALPALFVDVPPWVKVMVAGVTLATIVSVVLMMSPSPRPAALPERVTVR
ncbi:hypothetical protein [Janibacter limosus]|uniref:Uncharacterized protein n=1 Tax=Janibacter limosus TaxID=53458 RepID=A0A4P6MSP4_9MICO|nr:hypothetical protein [Janibacter limosus]QBF46751.1 hypothetical protein EXU32_11140 [Janibacter limosus]